MALPLPEWKRDHVLIPPKLHEVVYEGFTIHIKIEPQELGGKPIVETVIRKERPTEKVRPKKIAPMALHPSQFLPEALEFLRQGFTLVIHLSQEEIKVTAEKTLKRP